ncbi:hypothetical protein BHE74_00050997 [Ensete ventricosum]|nr:hypothetical protein BHE74_00050997 [Ensete ventricosum]
MDRDAGKRDREEPAEGWTVAVAAAELAKKKGKRGETGESRSMDVSRPPGLFEFPWQKGERLLVLEAPDEWDLRDVFFSSLVDGCSAAIGVPGDRLSPAAPDPFCLPEEPSDGDSDGGAECFWSSVLRPPPAALRRVQQELQCMKKDGIITGSSSFLNSAHYP